MGYHFSFVKIPKFANIYNSVHDPNFWPCLQKREPRPPGANSPCQYIRPLTSAAVIASIKPSICPQHAEHLAKVANPCIV